MELATKKVAPDWQPLLAKAMVHLSPDYLAALNQTDWLPGPDKLFNAFSLPLKETRYILFGEGPYPRKDSATGYAFIDGAVTHLWSATGLSKQVNRATSLRNIIKLLLRADGQLDASDTSQSAIAALDKTNLIQTLQALQQNLLINGVLLLNASLVFSTKQRVKTDARHWLPFIEELLGQLADQEITLIFWGKIAGVIKSLPAARDFKCIEAEHPYNLSLIENLTMHHLFTPMKLLQKRGQ